jgi:hypothetical protein
MRSLLDVGNSVKMEFFGSKKSKMMHANLRRGEG